MFHSIPRMLSRLALCLGLAAPALCPGLLWAQAPAAKPTPGGESTKPALSAEAAKLKKLLEDKFEGAAIGNVAKSPYFGLYEVQFDDQIVYTDAKANHVFVGSIYDANTKKNLTEARKRALARVSFETLPLELAFKRVKGNGTRKLAIFSDADCPFCARLEKELQNVDDVTIYTFLFPIDQLHPDAARKSRMIWCAPDRVKAWDEFFATGTLPANNGDCDTPLAATNTLGQKLRINATPTLVFADGSIVPGALPAARLEQEFKLAEVASKPVSARK
jgi:thiol:disulfide interchange protein DsbC